MTLKPIVISRGVENPLDSYPTNMYSFLCSVEWNNASDYNGMQVCIQLDDGGVIVDYQVMDPVPSNIHIMINKMVQSYDTRIIKYFKSAKLKLTVDQKIVCDDFEIKLKEL